MGARPLASGLIPYVCKMQRQPCLPSNTMADMATGDACRPVAAKPLVFTEDQEERLASQAVQPS
jgi:hypothetical protein